MTDAPLPKVVEETWVYLGLRFSRGTSEYHWRDEQGQPHIFAKRFKTADFVGARYRLDVTREIDGSGVTVGSRPRWVGIIQDDQERHAIQAEHRANEIAAQAWREAKKDSAPAALDALTITELRQKMRRLTVTRRRALLALVIDRLLLGAIDERDKED